MKKTFILSKKVKMRSPILIEGLPGIGLVGKIAADYMIKELKAEKVAELYSRYFPHQVLMQKKGTIRMLKNKFYLIPGKKHDLLVLVGDVQAVTPESQFEVCETILEYFEKNNGKLIYTLGGYGTGKAAEKPRALCVATHSKDIDGLKKYGLIFGEARGSIIGAAGMLLGLGKLRGMHGACVMGETHGGYVDAKSAKVVLEVLAKMVDLKINLSNIDEKAKEGEKFMKQMEREAEAQRQMQTGAVPNKDITYIR